MSRTTLLLLFFFCTLMRSVYANPIDKQAALEKAASFLKEGISTVSLRSSTTKASNAPLYIFSRGAGKGFIIVSGDDCLPSILGYTDSGDFIESDMPPALLDWLKYYSSIILEAQAQKAPAKVMQQTAAARVSVAPIIKTHWSQGAPYNNTCPFITGTTNRALTGCVATAAAQVVYHYRKDNPSTLLAKTPTYTYGSAPVSLSLPVGTPIKYDLMQNSYSTYPTEMGTAVATLMYAIGTSTWLTYGASTSGQIMDLVNTFSSGFNLQSTCVYKNQTGNWDNLVYNEMLNGRPTVYAGVNAADGGHAIVCDGYDAVTMMYHFNFGWGGQADGYYTLDDQTGINGYSSSQGMVYGIAPKKQALKADLELSDTLYQNLYNPVKVHLTNNGTLSYSGLYLFASESPLKPNSITSAVAVNLTAKVASGETVDLKLYYKPLKKTKYYLFITDSKLNLLDSISVPVGISYPNLIAKSFSVNAGGQSLDLNGKAYGLVNNTSALVTATVQNASNTYFDGLFRFTLGVSSDGSADSLITSTQSLQVAFNAQESKDISFTISDLKPGYYYSAAMTNSAFALGIPAPITFQKDSVIYFQSMIPTIKVDSTSSNWVKVSGNWNDVLFSSLMVGYPNATTMDLTGVIGLNSQPVAPNPNALFYVAQDVLFDGVNMIKGDTCAFLKLYKGADFQPLSDFHARKVLFYPKSTNNKWSTLCLPFDCPVPTGFMARELSKHTASSLTFSPIYAIKAGTPCMVMSAAPVDDCFSTQNVRVSIHAINQQDTAFVGTYTSLIPGSTTRVLNADALQYFVKPDGVMSLSAFSAYVKLVSVITKICPTNFTTDPSYLLLGQSLASATKTLTDYRKKASMDAVASYYDEILVAEAFFSAQTATLDADISVVTTELQDAGKVFLRSIGEMVDYTSWLVNPSFELKSIKGWTADNILYPSVRAMTLLDFYTVGFDGGYILQVMGKDSIGTNMHQKVINIPNGKYLVKASLATDKGHTVQLFANNFHADVSASLFGSYYFNEGSLETYVTDGTITLGANANGRWYKADNFRLYYMSADTTGASVALSNANQPVFPKVMGGKGKIVVQSNIPCRILVYDLSGRLVRQSFVQKGETHLDGLATGIYLVNRQKVMVW